MKLVLDFVALVVGFDDDCMDDESADIIITNIA
jgi:hypothetical protein